MALRPWNYSDAPADQRPIAVWTAKDAASLLDRDGAKLRAWVDQISGRRATAEYDSQRPSYVADTGDGYPGVLGNAAQYGSICLKIEDLTGFPFGSAGMDLIIIATSTETTNTQNAVIGWGNNDNRGPRIFKMRTTDQFGDNYENQLYASLGQDVFTRRMGTWSVPDAAPGLGVQVRVQNFVAPRVSVSREMFFATAIDSGYLFGRHYGDERFVGYIHEIILAPPLTDAVREQYYGRALHDWGIQGGADPTFVYATQRPMVDDGASAGSAGDVAATLGMVAAAASAVLVIAGMASVPLAPVGIMAPASAPIRASAASTLGAIAASGAALLVIRADAAPTLQSVTAQSAARLLIAGLAASELGSFSAAASGVLTVRGMASLALAPVAASSTSELALRGVAAITLSPVTVEARAGPTQSAGGVAAIALDPIAAVADGIVRISANAAPALASIQASGAGGIRIAAVANGQMAPVTAVGDGILPVRAASASLLGPIVAATSARLSIAGQLTGALQPLAIVAQARTSAFESIDIPLRNRFVIPARQRRFTIPARQRAFVIRKGTCMSSITKYAAEERQYQADWSADLNGQTIAGEIVATSSDPTLIVDRVTYNGALMKFWVKGGASGRLSTIRFDAPTSGGEGLVWQQTVVVF
ncbi:MULTISPECIES: hypothetical protein [unclassified Sphingomonas]|uniref:phage fiber-tail adaptor protein n=1 Tax=unclassified Sphingomonas TaxID=196159 RepID=UPI0025DCB1B5|nr:MULTISPECIES: hypothetical protein [unclassified Sphingomonas]